MLRGHGHGASFRRSKSASFDGAKILVADENHSASGLTSGQLVASMHLGDRRRDAASVMTLRTLTGRRSRRVRQADTLTRRKSERYALRAQ